MCERHRITTFNARRYWLKLILHQFVGGNAHHAEYDAHVYSDARVDLHARNARTWRGLDVMVWGCLDLLFYFLFAYFYLTTNYF